jgi:hypothetical protein
MALAREWDALVEEVRELAGFQDFLRPPPLETLLSAAERGPVAVVNVSRWRCDALIVTTEGIRPVELPDLTAEQVTQRTSAYLRALQDSTNVSGAASFTEGVEQRRRSLSALRETLRSTLEWLWDVVADPILKALRLVETPPDGGPWPRLWWCPTGLLTLLPLHGAGYHDAGDGRAVIDRVVSSYTPTLRALGESAEAWLEPAPDRSDLLFVGVPDAVDQLPLTEVVAKERAFLTKRFPGGLTVLDGSEATVSEVSKELAAHRWAHISCHGHQDVNDPSGAGFQLSDGRLTVTRISAARHAGEFAFLSACKTATGGINLPDEVITLAAALSYTGYRHVVATLWTVNPRVVADVSEAVYSRLISDGAFHPERSAEALHHAVRGLRASGRSLDSWLPFTHNGP